jgi:AcrR family transcriptional regulator
MPNMNSPSGGAKRRGTRRDATLERLLDGALKVFAERGYHAANIHEICTRSSVGIGTFYAHFDDKKELITRLMTERAVALLGAITSDDLLDRPSLTRRVKAYLDDPVAVGLWSAWREATLADEDLRRIDARLRTDLVKKMATSIRGARLKAHTDRRSVLDPLDAAWVTFAATRAFATHDRGGAPSLETLAQIIRHLALGSGED